jgi:two-component system sensor histidine kinase UhpB
MPASIEVREARILVVDDVDADARLVQALLGAAGFTSVSTLTDPRLACDRHRRDRYDLVILDLLMPHMDGFAVLEALARIEPECPVPVIVITAEPDLLRRALEAGARDFVGKPLSAIELLPRVRNAIQLGALMREAHARKVALERTLSERTADLEEAQDKYRALVEQSIAGIYIIDDGRWEYLNPRLCEMLGYRDEELIGTDSINLVVEEDHARLLDNRRRAFAGDREALKGIFRMRRRDGAVLTVSFEARLIELHGRTVIFGVATDETERTHAQLQLEAAYVRLRALSDRVLAVQEEERRRISRELHDDIGQSLVALDIGLHRLAPHVAASRRAALDECIEVAGAVREKLREISLDLHPPHLDQLGLQDALRWLVSRHRDLTGLGIECRFAAVESLRIAPAIEAACYRICQEALSNATRHSSARHIEVELTVRNGQLVAAVADDGNGFDPGAQREALLTTGRMGLVSMAERARLAGGRFELTTVAGAGTRVSATFPIDACAAQSAAPRERV